MFFQVFFGRGGVQEKRHDTYYVHAQNTGIYTTHCAKDVEQDTLSQASTMPKTLVFTVFLRLCTTYCTRMWNKKSCHKRPCLLATMLENTCIYSVFVSLRPTGCGLRVNTFNLRNRNTTQRNKE